MATREVQIERFGGNVLPTKSNLVSLLPVLCDHPGQWLPFLALRTVATEAELFPAPRAVATEAELFLAPRAVATEGEHCLPFLVHHDVGTEGEHCLPSLVFHAIVTV